MLLQRAAGQTATSEGKAGGEDNGAVQIFDQEKVRFLHITIKSVLKNNGNILNTIYTLI